MQLLVMGSLLFFRQALNEDSYSQREGHCIQQPLVLSIKAATLVNFLKPLKERLKVHIRFSFQERIKNLRDEYQCVKSMLGENNEVIRKQVCQPQIYQRASRVNFVLSQYFDGVGLDKTYPSPLINSCTIKGILNRCFQHAEQQQRDQEDKLLLTHVGIQKAEALSELQQQGVLLLKGTLALKN